MFGYVKIYEPELKMREYAAYQACYCGLCRQIGKDYGKLPKLFLSYDMVFLALTRMALTNQKCEYEAHRCIVHPFKKKQFLSSNQSLAYTASASIILLLEKAMDDAMDERSVKRARGRKYTKLLRRKKKKVDKVYHGLSDDVMQSIEQFHQYELRMEDSVDIPAELFSKAMASLFAYGFSGDKKTIASSIGLHIGKWAYLVDALDDFEKDQKTGSYNPLVNRYPTLDEQAKKEIQRALQGECESIKIALDLIVTDNATDSLSILTNIVEYGMPYTTNEIIQKKGACR